MQGMMERCIQNTCGNMEVNTDNLELFRFSIVSMTLLSNRIIYKQKFLDTDPMDLKQISFNGNIERPGKTRFSHLEKIKEAIIKFSENNANSYKFF